MRLGDFSYQINPTGALHIIFGDLRLTNAAGARHNCVG
jgi:hypothetical protein